MNGAWPLSQAKPTPSQLPARTPSGPMRKAVRAPTMIIEKNGTNTICTLSGIIFLSPW